MTADGVHVVTNHRLYISGSNLPQFGRKGEIKPLVDSVFEPGRERIVAGGLYFGARCNLRMGHGGMLLVGIE